MPKTGEIHRDDDAAIVELVLDGDGDVVERLEVHRDRFSPDLATAFLTAARGLFRTDPAAAEARADLARHVAEAVGDEVQVTDCWRAVAEARVLAGRFVEALAALDRAFDLADRRKDRLTQASINALRLHALTHLERYEQARECGRRALGAFGSAKNDRGKLRVHMALADLEYRLDQPREALAHYTAAERLMPDPVPQRVLAALCSNRANALDARNRFHAARRHFERAVELFEANDCRHSAAQTRYNLAYSEFLRGRYEDALSRYAEVETEFEELDDRRHLAHVHLDRAEILLQLNLPKEAEDAARQAEAAFVGLRQIKEAAQAARLLGCALELQRKHADADRFYLRAEQAFAGLGLHERRISCLTSRAQLAIAAGDLPEAERIASDAAVSLDASTNVLIAAGAKLALAGIDLARGQGMRAIAAADDVLETCRRVHAPWTHLAAHHMRARAYVALERDGDAVLAYKQAVDILDAYRGGVPPDEYMTAFLAGRSALYEEIVALLVRTEQVEEAFEFTERAKSRALVDLLAGQRPRPKGEPGPSETRLTHLQERLNAVYQRLFRETGGTDARSLSAVLAARREAGKLEGAISRLLRDRRLGGRDALATTETPDLEAIRNDLEEDTTLVAYFLTADTLFTFVVSRDATQVVRQPASPSDIRRNLELFHFQLTRQEHRRNPSEASLVATRDALGTLAAILLDPIAEHLTTSRLVVIPHGVLHHVPVHALPWGDGWVADEFEVVHAPSAAVYAQCGRQQSRTSGGAAVFGLPDEAAPRIEDEARQVAALLGTHDVHLGDDATLARLRTAAAEARVVHIATHGMFRPEHPMLSSIRLADRWVNLYDLYSLEVRSDLVVLSTCESGIADVTDGNEILGLTRGFLYAGAPALLTSQWRVSDAVTTEFMGRFYHHLGESGDVATAHKAAMSDIRALRPHPYYWAPFFVTGRPVAGALRGADVAAECGSAANATSDLARVR